MCGLPYKKEEHAAINERSCNVKNWLVVEIVVVIVYMSLFTFMNNILEMIFLFHHFLILSEMKATKAVMQINSGAK